MLAPVTTARPLNARWQQTAVYKRAATLLVLCATLAAAEGFVEIRRWGREKLAFEPLCP